MSMKKNKWFYPSKGQIPSHGQEVIYVSLRNGLKPIKARYNDYQDSFYGPPEGDELLSNVKAWRPLKTKLNKYRWREMKDEKPDIGEMILFCFKPRDEKLPMTSKYEGVACNKDEYEWINYTPLCSDGNWGISLFCRSDIILWRKMCRLPGE